MAGKARPMEGRGLVIEGRDNAEDKVETGPLHWAKGGTLAMVEAMAQGRI